MYLAKSSEQNKFGVVVLQLKWNSPPTVSNHLFLKFFWLSFVFEWMVWWALTSSKAKPVVNPWWSLSLFRASRNMAGGRNETKRTLFIIDGAGSHKVVDDLFFVIDIAIIPAPCTDEIQLMDVVVNAKYKDSLYYQWAMWMMNGPLKVQPKSGNFVAADFQTILSWCTYAWK